MRRYITGFIFSLLLISPTTQGGEPLEHVTTDDGPFRGVFVEKEMELKMEIDLYKECVEVPEMEMFGPLNGYINGKGLYRVWYISKLVECGPAKAVVHFSNDLGSETQTVELTMQGDSLLHCRIVDYTVMKKAVGKKLVKLPSSWVMKRQ